MKQIIAFEPVSRYNVDNAKESDCYERKSSESSSGDGSAGEISNEGGHEIFHIALKHVELVDQIVYILEMDLPEKDTIAKIKQLV